MKQRRSFVVLSAAAVFLLLVTVFPVHVVAMRPGVDSGSVPAGEDAPSSHAGDQPEAVAEEPQDPNAPTIDFWYDAEQYFGQNGAPQPWINILGNVWDVDGVASLTYEINNHGQRPLTIGLDGIRLEGPGDFNADPPLSDFQDGENQVVFRARDARNNMTTRTVTVNCDAGNVWQLPYYIDWSEVNDIQQVAQIVDGYWEIRDDQLHNVQEGYDRLVAIGDMSWTDYEVTVPITIHSMWDYGRPGVGIVVRWNGHANDSDQPHNETPFGGLGWYRSYYSGPELEIMGNDGDIIDHKSHSLLVGQTYIFKMRVETSWKNDYYLKVWSDGSPEPSGWDLHAKGTWVDPDAESHGSVVLVAHRSDASFGNVTITPLQDRYSLTIETVAGQGTVGKSPSGPYGYGEMVTLTPQPAVGYLFDGWGGEDVDDLVDKGDGTWSLSMVKNRHLTISFVDSDCHLTLDTVGEGTVDKDPDKDPHDCGEQVTLMPNPALGWSFDTWTGPDQGDPVDNGDGTWSLTMDADKTLTANFAQDQYSLTISFSPTGMGMVVREPDRATYLYGQVVTLTPVPEPGWNLTQWTGPSAGDMVDNGDDTWSLTMDGDKELTANFAEALYEVTVMVIGPGWVSHTPGNPYLYLELATLAPSPIGGSLFAGWTGPDAADLMAVGDGTWRLRINEDKEVTAKFASTSIYVPLVTNNY